MARYAFVESKKCGQKTEKSNLVKTNSHITQEVYILIATTDKPKLTGKTSYVVPTEVTIGRDHTYTLNFTLYAHDFLFTPKIGYRSFVLQLIRLFTKAFIWIMVDSLARLPDHVL